MPIGRACLFLLLPLATIGCGNEAPSPKAPAPAVSNTQSQSATLDDSLDLIARDEVTLEELLQAKEELVAADPHQVLPRLLERQLSVSMGHWNGFGSTEMNLRHLPPEPRAFYEYVSVWDTILNRDRETLSPLLLEMLAEVESGSEKAMLIDYLRLYWIDEAEAPVAEVLHNHEPLSSAWWAAARCLQDNRPTAYHDELMDAALNLPTETWQELNLKSRLLHEIMEPRRIAIYQKREELPPVDPLVVAHGFDTVLRMQADNGSSAYGGHLLAMQLGGYLGLDFHADQDDPRFHRETGGTSDLLYQAGIDNTLRWWAEHRKQYPELGRDTEASE